MKNKKNIYRILLLILGLAVLGYMVYKIGLDEILKGVGQVRWWFLAIIALWIGIYVLNAISWNIIIRREDKGSRPSFFNVVRITISGFAINYITPFVALGGEPYRIFELKEYMGGQKATSCVILYSMMHIFTHIIFWMFSILLAMLYLRPALIPFLLLFILFLVFVGTVYLFLQAYKKGLVVSSFNFLSKIPFVNKWARKFIEKHENSLHEIDTQIAHLHTYRRSSFYLSFLAEFSSRLLGCLEVNIIMIAIASLFPTLNVTVADAIIITAAYSLFANIVFFVPMQIGSREGGYLLAFEAVGSLSAPAIIVSLITRIRELFWILIGVILMRVGAGKTKVKEHFISQNTNNVN